MNVLKINDDDDEDDDGVNGLPLPSLWCLSTPPPPDVFIDPIWFSQK